MIRHGITCRWLDTEGDEIVCIFESDAVRKLWLKQYNLLMKKARRRWKLPLEESDCVFETTIKYYGYKGEGGGFLSPEQAVSFVETWLLETIIQTSEPI